MRENSRLVRWLDHVLYPGVPDNWDDRIFRELIINELRGCREDLAEDNARAEWEAEQREKLEQAMRINEKVWKNAPRVVRDYAKDTVSVYAGERKVM